MTQVKVLSVVGLRYVLTQRLHYFKARPGIGIYPALRMQFDYGLRIKEVLNIAQWTVEDGVIMVQTLKGGGRRKIRIETLHEDVKALVLRSVNEKENYLCNRNYQYVNKQAKVFDRFYSLKVNGAFQSTHISRHLYFKFLIDEGFSNKKIQEVMALKKVETIGEYASSEITVRYAQV